LATINQLRTERLAYFRELKRGLRTVDSAIEKAQRKVDSVIARKRDVPEVNDFEQITETIQALGEAARALSAILEAGALLFGM
jgi:hypothetical protein